jgi:hypothetical protein
MHYYVERQWVSECGYPAEVYFYQSGWRGAIIYLPFGVNEITVFDYNTFNSDVNIDFHEKCFDSEYKSFMGISATLPTQGIDIFTFLLYQAQGIFDDACYPNLSLGVENHPSLTEFVDIVENVCNQLFYIFNMRNGENGSKTS